MYNIRYCLCWNSPFYSGVLKHFKHINLSFLFQCLQYRTEHAQDVKKLEKLTSQLMRHMASKEK